MGDAFEDGEVIEQCFGGDVAQHAKVLREVAERFACGRFLPDHVEMAEADGAAIGLLQRRQDAHERRLAGAVGTEETEHAGGDGEGEVLQRLHAVRIGLGEIFDAQLEGHAG